MGFHHKWVEFEEQDFLTCKLAAILVNVTQCPPGSAGGWTITGVTNTTNPTVTTSAAHGLATGDYHEIFGVNGATGANGVSNVSSVPSTTTFVIPRTSAPGVYTGGGFLWNLHKTFLSEIVPTAARVARVDIPTAGRDALTGYIYTADFSFVDAPATTSHAIVLVRSANLAADADLADTAQRPIVVKNQRAPGSSGLPVTPLGAGHSVNVAVDPTYGWLGL